jgi:hypothetical protein
MNKRGSGTRGSYIVPVGKNPDGTWWTSVISTKNPSPGRLAQARKSGYIIVSATSQAEALHIARARLDTREGPKTEVIEVVRVNGDISILWPDGSVTLALDPADALSKIKSAAKAKVGRKGTLTSRIEWYGITPPEEAPRAAR